MSEISPPAKPTGISRLWRALRASIQGLRAAIRDEAAFRQELMLLAVAVPLALWLGDGAGEKLLLILPLLLVLALELLNSAIEAVVDLASPQLHPLAGKAKDCASAAVLVGLVATALIWLVLLLN